MYHLPFVEPLPDLIDGQWLTYLQHRQSLGVGLALVRSPIPRSESVSDYFRASGGLPPLVFAVRDEPRAVETLRGTSRGQDNRPIEWRSRVYLCRLPENGFDTEVAVHVWRSERKRGYVKGWAQPLLPRPSPFGTPETRFRTFSQEPYFPETGGFFGRINTEQTRWNDYQIGKQVETAL